MMQDLKGIIDRIHGDGDLPSIPLKLNSMKRAAGTYYSTFTGEAVKIEVSRYGGHKGMTAAHEIGHFLDQRGIGRGRFASETDTRMSEWRDAVRNSKAAKRIEELSRQTKAKVVVNGQELEYYIDRRYVRYLSQWNELWARSYAQYVAHKSGDASLLAQLDDLRRQSVTRLYYPTQWDDEDFKPIAAAIDKLMKELGWVQE
jgi:hypothetical protein